MSLTTQHNTTTVCCMASYIHNEWEHEIDSQMFMSQKHDKVKTFYIQKVKGQRHCDIRMFCRHTFLDIIQH